MPVILLLLSCCASYFKPVQLTVNSGRISATWEFKMHEADGCSDIVCPCQREHEHVTAFHAFQSWFYFSFFFHFFVIFLAIK